MICSEKPLALYEQATEPTESLNMNTLAVSSTSGKPIQFKLLFALNAVFMLFLCVAGTLIASDLQSYSDNFKLIGAIHAVTEIGADIDGEYFFLTLCLLGFIGIIGSALMLRAKRVGFWFQFAGLFPLIVIGLFSLSEISLILSFAGALNAVVIYSGLAICIALLIANFRTFRRMA